MLALHQACVVVRSRLWLKLASLSYIRGRTKIRLSRCVVVGSVLFWSANSVGMFLSTRELEALTGRKHVRAQLHWLRVRRWIHEVDADGRPVLLRSYVESQLGAAGAVRESAVVEPNWSFLNESKAAEPGE